VSFPEGAEYWHDVKAHFGRTRYGGPALHAVAPGVSMTLLPGQDTRGSLETACGITIQRQLIRGKRSKVTCRNCLAKLCRFVVTHEVDGVVKVLLATDDANAAQEKFYQATDHKLRCVVLRDRDAPPAG
jgi:hypothetical protein